jgi:hypothetical protein
MEEAPNSTIMEISSSVTIERVSLMASENIFGPIRVTLMVLSSTVRSKERASGLSRLCKLTRFKDRGRYSSMSTQEITRTIKKKVMGCSNGPQKAAMRANSRMTSAMASE